MTRRAKLQVTFLAATILLYLGSSDFALAADVDWHAEIALLASSNPPPTIKEPTHKPIFAKSFRWEDGEKRIMAKVTHISSHVAEVLPYLVAHAGDPEYATTHEAGNGYWSNMTVGHLCCEIIHHGIEVRSDLIPIGSNRQSRSLVGHRPENIKKWWSTRRKRELKDLQREWLEFAVQLQSDDSDDDEAKERIRAFEIEIEKIKTTGKALPTTYSFQLRPK